MGTGCTVFLIPEPNRAVASIRGGAPGSREVPALAPGNLVENVNALFFSGGSAFGLRCGEGVVDFLHMEGEGFDTPAGKIPIVAGAVIYDLEVGRPGLPEIEWGYRASREAGGSPLEGSVGAGTGASVGKAVGIDRSMKGGFGKGTVDLPEGEVSAYVVTNSLGDIVDPGNGIILAGCRNQEGTIAGFFHMVRDESNFYQSPFNTTLFAAFFDFFLTREELFSLTQVAHSALASCIRPYGTRFDGDCLFLVSCSDRRPPAYFHLISALYEASRLAITRSVTEAQGVAGIPSRNDIMRITTQQSGASLQD